jgi:hypothetical protein
MTAGTNDKKKLAFLAVLGLGAVYGVYSNLSEPSHSSANSVTPGSRGGAGSQRAGSPADLDSGSPALGSSTPPASQSMAPDLRRAAPGARPRGEEFRPALHSKRKEDQINPMDVDPTLRTDLLAKVQAVKLEGGQRNLFQFGSIVETPKLTGPEPVVAVAHAAYDYPRPLVEKPKEVIKDPAELPPPPIPYKYYGLSTTRIGGKRTAFFLDGEEIILATEGMVVKKRYKVVRIGATSVVMEDVDSRKQQTVNYSEEAQNAQGG